MNDLKAKEYWNRRYANNLTSGYGSYGDALVRKLHWLKDLDIKSISDIGCGDFNFGKHLTAMYPGISYVGLDQSDYIINKHQVLVPQFKFTTNIDEVPPADLVLCIDVLFHLLGDGEVEPLLKELEKRWTKYLALTAYERDEDLDSEHVRIRKFDPSRFGTPIIREIAEENGELYFYLYKKN